MKVDKKKFILLGVGIFLVLILLVSATYAYFALNIVKNNSSTNINANTTAVDNIAIKKANDDLHLALSAEDMSLGNLGAYYATVDENNFEKDENIVSIAELTAVGGDVNASYNCQVKVTISPSSTDNMTSLLQEGDAEFYISYGDLLEKYDLYNLQTLNTKVFTGNILLINNSNDFVRAYIKVMNKEGDQSYLAGHNLNLDINTEIVSCDVVGQSKTELVLRSTSTSGTLSKNLIGGMYRYQGQANDVTDNYICFGTDDKQTCLNNQNEFMYRIIGVTPDGRIKVIKKEALDQPYQWWDNADDNISWAESKTFKAINGADFLNNEKYVPDGWEDKIASNNWIYGDSGAEDTNAVGSEVYKTERGAKIASWLVPATEVDGIPYFNRNPDREEYYNKNVYYKTINGFWNKVVNAKISTMYINDYYLSVSDDANCHYYNGNYDVCRTGWLHISQNDSNHEFVDYNSEMTMNRIGWDYWNVFYLLTSIHYDGKAFTQSINNKIMVRPVFYLNSNINISGNGTTADPYMIEL